MEKPSVHTHKMGEGDADTATLTPHTPQPLVRLPMSGHGQVQAKNQCHQPHIHSCLRGRDLHLITTEQAGSFSFKPQMQVRTLKVPPATMER